MSLEQLKRQGRVWRNAGGNIDGLDNTMEMRLAAVILPHDHVPASLQTFLVQVPTTPERKPSAQDFSKRQLYPHWTSRRKVKAYGENSHHNHHTLKTMAPDMQVLRAIPRLGGRTRRELIQLLMTWTAPPPTLLPQKHFDPTSRHIFLHCCCCHFFTAPHLRVLSSSSSNL